MGFMHQARRGWSGGFTIPEVLTVVGIIAVLLAVLVPALSGAKRSADMASSMNNLRQVVTLMQQYSAQHREYIVPSQFDYTAAAALYPVQVRSDVALGAQRYKGTWADILWTFGGFGTSAKLIDPTDSTNEDKYLFDSPDKAVYEHDPDYQGNPFRSAAPNTTDFLLPNGTLGNGPKPFGTGALEGGLPGFFAANNFFNTDPASPAVSPTNPAMWYVTGQIKQPNRSMYLVDSFAGETIDPVDAPYFNDNPIPPATHPSLEVDLRYSGACLMLFLDGHSAAQGGWSDLDNLEKGTKIKIRELDKN